MSGERVVNHVVAKEGPRSIAAGFKSRVLDGHFQPQFVANVQRIREGTFREVRSRADLPEGRP